MIACNPPDKVFPFSRTLTIFLFACILSLSSQAQDADTIQVLPKTPTLLKVTDEEPVLFGFQKKSRLLQSTATVYTDQLSTTPNPQFIQALPGRLAGLNIRFFGIGPGLDGNGTSFDIRGARAQVILVDGVERGYMSIDPEQIESITLLKDALSTVMFGQRSSYGIISVKTKKGDVGKPRISFTAQSGSETPTALPKPVAAWQQATLYNEAARNDLGQATTQGFSQAQIDAYRNQTDPYTYPDVNWYKTVLKKNAPISRYNLNVQGSGKGFRYFVDLDKLTEKGLLKTDDNNPYNTNVQLDRYILRSNLGANVTPTTFVQLNLFGRFQRYNQPGGGIGTILLSLLTTPQLAYPVYNPNGTYGGTNVYGENANIYGQAVSRGYLFQDARDIAVDLDVTQKLDVLTKGLYIKARGSNNNTAYFTTARTKNFEVYQYSNTNNAYAKYGTSTEQTTSGGASERSRIVYVEGNVGYDRTFGKHALEVLVVANRQSRLAFNSTNLPENYTAYAGKLNYAYDEKYLIEGAVSYGGYNWLTPAKRWATYWAAGLGWNMHNERFIKESLPFISNLKLRANYGLTGQVNAGYFSYIQTYYNNLTKTDNAVAYWYGPGSSLERSTGENAIANPNLGPEKAKKLDAGVDLGFFNNKLTVTADYFYNKFYDLVAQPTMTTTVFGANYPVTNYQKFNYYGGEIMATWQEQRKDFAYYISGNLSLVQSKVVYNGELPKQYDYQVLTGKPVGMLYGYTATGLFRSYDEINDPATAVLPAAPKPTTQALGSLRPGDIRYLDRNEDGIIDENDKSGIGNGKPGISFGGNIGFRFKGFDFSALVQGTINRQSYIAGDFMNGFGNGGAFTAYEYNLGRFTEATAQTATQPRVWLGANTNNSQTSSFWLFNNDFVRLKNVEVGYTIPQNLTRRIGASTVRFFANGLNLLTWAEIYKVRKDLDPESWGSVYPVMKVFNFGINVKF